MQRIIFLKRVISLLLVIILIAISIGPSASAQSGVYGSAGNTPANAVYVDEAGKVGIGTTTPGTKLHIEGSATGGGLYVLGNVEGGNIAKFRYPGDGTGGIEIAGDTAGSKSMYVGLIDQTAVIRNQIAGKAIQFQTASSSALTILDDGKVGIGTATPGTKLHIEGGVTGGGLYVLGNVEGGNIAKFRYPGNGTGGIEIAGDAAGSQSIYVGLTDQSAVIRNNIVGKSLLLQTTPSAGTKASVTVLPDGTLSTRVLQITGGGDLAEPFAMAKPEEIQPGMVVAIDPNHEGQLKLAKNAYDRTVVGVVSGAGGIEAGVLMYQEGASEDTRNVALSGRVYVWADASNGAIQPGDLLTTAKTPGHAMKVTDHDKAQGAILGKAMGKLEKGTGLVLILVTLQ